MLLCLSLIRVSSVKMLSLSLSLSRVAVSLV